MAGLQAFKPIRPVILGRSVLVELYQVVVGCCSSGASPLVLTVPEQLIFEVRALIDMLVAIGALMMLHNLYAGASSGIAHFAALECDRAGRDFRL